MKGELGDTKREIIKIGKGIGIEIEIEQLRKVKTGKEERGEMVIVKIITEENRRKILENKKKLRRKDVWLEEDQTFKERKMK